MARFRRHERRASGPSHSISGIAEPHPRDVTQPNSIDASIEALKKVADVIPAETRSPPPPPPNACRAWQAGKVNFGAPLFVYNEPVTRTPTFYGAHARDAAVTRRLLLRNVPRLGILGC